ncbi:MAG: hypothetical protein NT094_05600 [Candidatus Staskawiczbacteria bacterium]|nr:hypothetical protein [Candidatus Staskawiczbacteria bacterium]
MKIGTKITFSFLLIVGLIVGIISVIISIQILSAMESQAYDNIKNINSIKAAHIETFLNSEKEIISSLAASSVFRQFLKTPVSSPDYNNQKEISTQKLFRSVGGVAQIKDITIVGADGKMLISTDPERFNGDYSKDPCFIAGSKDIYIEDPEVGTEGKIQF